ncbi:MAG: hypothetical protein WA252_20310 [Candidatus Sulfotelmatobacter sp.]
MSSTGDSLAERVKLSYLQLSDVASDLNTVSDELGKSVATIDAALKKLNLGVTVWATVTEWEHELDYQTEQVGYAKVGNKWGIALRIVDGNHNWPDQENVEAWLFGDGPRQLRLKAIEKLPELLKTLSEEAVAATERIKSKLAEVKEVADAVHLAAWGEPEARRRVIRRVGEEQKK